MKEQYYRVQIYRTEVFLHIIEGIIILMITIRCILPAFATRILQKRCSNPHEEYHDKTYSNPDVILVVATIVFMN